MKLPDKRTHHTKISSRQWTAPEGKLFKIGNQPPKKTLDGKEIVKALEKIMVEKGDREGLYWLFQQRNTDTEEETLAKIVQKGYISLVDENEDSSVKRHTRGTIRS